MIIIGSYALKHFFPEYNSNPKDLDVVVLNDHSVITANIRVEYHVVEQEIYEEFKKYSDISGYLLPDALYTLKVSHLPWEGKNNKWWKHMKDVKFLKENGCTLIKSFHSFLIIYWGKKFGDKSHISFNKDSEYFFNDNVKRETEHDKLHEYFKIGEYPAYKDILTDGHSVLCSEEKFKALDRYRKFCTVLEEMFVLSVERNISLELAFKKLVTDMSKGFWNTFLIENVSEILDGFEEENKIFREKRKVWTQNLKK